MTVARITGEDMAELVMRRRRKVQSIMDLETQDERLAVERAEKVLAAARADLEERRAPYLAEIAQAENLLFQWFAEFAENLPGTKTKKLLKGGAWGKDGSGFHVGRGKVVVTDAAVQAIADAARMAGDLEDRTIRLQAQVERLGEAFHWLADYCGETDLDGAEKAVDLLLSLVQWKPSPDGKAAADIMAENPLVICENLRLDTRASFILEGAKVASRTTGKPLTVAWPPAPPAEGGEE